MPAVKNTLKTKPALITPLRPSRAEAEEAVRTLILWAGENPERPSVKDTPARVVRAFEEYFAGYGQDAGAILSRTFEETGGYAAPVLVRNIDISSRCEHHLAPIVGHAHIAYIPRARIVGLSKLARLADMYARRMQTQERLTAEISAALEKHLKPKGVAVMIEAEHFCMKERGVRKEEALTVTTHFSGLYKKDAALRTQFLANVALPA